MNNGNQQDAPLTPAGTDTLENFNKETPDCPLCGAGMPYLRESMSPCCRRYLAALDSTF